MNPFQLLLLLMMNMMIIKMTRVNLRFNEILKQKTKMTFFIIIVLFEEEILRNHGSSLDTVVTVGRFNIPKLSPT